MSIINDLKNEVASYATNNCVTSIVDFRIISGSNNQYLDVNEEFRFKVRILNQGPLDMKNVCLYVMGTEYSQVAIPNWPAGPFVNWGSCNIDAYQLYTTGDFGGRAILNTGGVTKDIVKVRISSWDASLDHILIDRSGVGAFEGVLNIVVRPN